MGNGEAKEIVYMTHGHELRWGKCQWEEGTGWKGLKGRKNWDNCNSIINKIYFKKRIHSTLVSAYSWYYVGTNIE